MCSNNFIETTEEYIEGIERGDIITRGGKNQHIRNVMNNGRANESISSDKFGWQVSKRALILNGLSGRDVAI